MTTIEETPLALEVRKENLAEQEGIALTSAFMPFFQEARNLQAEAQKIVVTDIDQKDVIAKAREMRLKMKNIRTSAESARKTLKDESLRRGRAIDGMANIIKFLIVPIEEHLEAQEDFVDIQNRKKIEEVRQLRLAELKAFEVDGLMYKDLGDMPEDMYKNLIIGAETAFNLKKDAAAKAEKQRKEMEAAAAAEQERIRIQNAELKKKAEAEAKKRQEEEQRRIAAEGALQTIRAEEERKEKQRKADEAKAKKEAKKLAAAPDKNKLWVFTEQIEQLELPDLKTDEAKMILAQAEALLAKVVKYVRDNADAL